MNAVTVAAGAVQLVGGVVLAPLLPGLVQHWKARLQGRRGPTPVQPYRDLRRLWGKSAVAVEGTSVVYRLAPSVVAASLGAAVLLVPVAAQAPDWGLGHDVLVLVGLLSLARFAVAASSWDTGNGFSLMGARRDLTLSAFVEGTLLVSLAVVTLVTGTTDLRAMIAGSVGGAWSSPLLAIGAVPFAMVVLVETGRQPVDNPDTPNTSVPRSHRNRSTVDRTITSWTSAPAADTACKPLPPRRESSSRSRSMRCRCRSKSIAVTRGGAPTARRCAMPRSP